MATELAKLVHGAIEVARNPIIRRLDPPDARIPWPGQSRSLWPQADISGVLTTDEAFIVEIDDHADPARSFVKYWPLLHAMESGAEQFPRIAFVEVSKPDSTFGAGYQELARFIAQRFSETYRRQFRFLFIDLEGKDPAGIAREVLGFLKQRVGQPV